jgi:hypothetical protein
MRTSLRLLAALALVAVGGAPRPVRALCALPQLLAPRPGQTNVPLDARLWFAYQSADDQVTFKLVGPDGELSLDTRKVALPGLPYEGFVATPKQELAPSTSYDFEVTCAQQTCDSKNRFTTGTARAAKPALPVVRKEEPFTWDGAEGSDRAVLFEFEPQDLLVVVEVAGTSAFRAEQPESALVGAWGVDRVWVGDKSCNLSEVRFPLQTRPQIPRMAMVRFGRVDLAGRFSGWTAARSVTLPTGAGGCSVSGLRGAEPPFGLVALAVLAGLARRRLREPRR